MDLGKSNAAQLREIEAAIRLSRNGGPFGPAGGKAVLGGVGAYMALELAAYLGVPRPFWWTSLAAALVAAGVILVRAPYKSYTALIYNLLLQYEPKDTAAYKTLQADVSAHGLRRQAVEAWLAAEWQAISTPLKMSEEQQRFVNKKVGIHLAGKD